MTISSDFRDALVIAYTDTVRRVIAGHPSMTTADLASLLAEHPQLESLTLRELFAEPRAEAPQEQRKPEPVVWTRSSARLPIRQPQLGQLVRTLRKRAGLTRAALTDAVDVTSSAIVRLERGQDVRLSTYLPVLEYFVVHDPQVWMIAERIVLLAARSSAGFIASLRPPKAVKR